MKGEATFVELIEQLYYEHRAPLLQCLYSIVGDAATAEDLLQETFVKVLRQQDRVLTIDAALPWLTRIATNTAYDHFRRQKRGPGRAGASDNHAEELLNLLPSPRLTEQPGSSELDTVIDIRAVIAQLPASKRLPLVLHYFGGYTLKDIAAIMCVETGTARSRLFPVQEAVPASISKFSTTCSKRREP